MTPQSFVAAIGKISNRLLSMLAGVASFAFTLLGFLLMRGINQQVVASLTIGLFALLVVWVAAERPNSRHARAVSALIDRLMAVRTGDLASPAPSLLRAEMPALAAAVDGLFEQVRSNLDNVNAMAMYDPVTALPNRIHFKREAERTLASRAPEESAGLLFIDLDGFKEVNDRLGHAEGDQLLVMVANRLRIAIKGEARGGEAAQPLIARLAGDEFTVLLPGIENADEAVRIANCALAALAESFRLAGASTRMGGSIGVAICPDHGADLTSLMKAADIAMYHAKASGRSRVCLYDEALARACEERIAAETVLREAIEQEAFELAFQPLLSMRSGRVESAEAVLCWRRSTGELELPDSFLGLAEESSLILDIGRWWIDAAAEALARWRAAGLPQRMCLKISHRQLERPDFFHMLRGALSRSGPAPWPVELSLSETCTNRFGPQLKSDLAALRADGVTLAIHDFGAGYSSLAGMRELPADRVKLARELVSEIDTSENARTIVSALIHLVHGLDAQAIAEGVERPDQTDVLRAIGCDVIQGGGIAQPMPEKAFVAWIEGRQAARPLARAS